MGDDIKQGRPAARRLALDIEAGDGAAWTCLGSGDAAKLARSVAAALARSRKLPAPRTIATLVLSHDAAVRALNKQWRGFDKPTNVLSFPSAAPPGPANARPRAARHIGDVILAEETLAREAADLGITPGDHFRHLVLHGLLHLLGWDHETDEDADEMEALETRILATLGVADPYAGTGPLKPGRPPKKPRKTSPRAL